MKKMIYNFILIGLFSLNTTQTFSQAGSLDATFDSDGKVTTVIGSGDDYGYAVATQADGKIVAVGYSFNGSNDDFAVARYNSNGTLDNTFDTDGKLTTDFASDADYAYSVAIQADGKILVAGYSSNGSNDDFSIARYTSTGALDVTFSSDGKLLVDFTSTSDYGYSIALQSDGKIVVAGGSNSGGSSYNFAVVRINTDGTLDNTFDTDGKVTTDFSTSTEYGRAVQIQSDGKIVVTGESSNGTDDDFAVARYTSTGALDVTFDTDGKVKTPIGLANDGPLQLAIQSDGKIIVVGSSADGFESDFSIVRYNANGSLDNTFDTDGKLMTPVGTQYDYANGVLIQSDGKIIVTGYTGNGLLNDFALIRLNSTGAFDNTFDTDGIVTTDFGTSNEFGYGATMQTDGKIIVVGSSDIGANNSFALARYNVATVGIEEEIFGGMTIFPNPTTGLFQINFTNATEIISIDIVSINGQIILHQENLDNSNFSFDISSQPAALYVLEIKTNKGLQRMLITKK